MLFLMLVGTVKYPKLLVSTKECHYLNGPFKELTLENVSIRQPCATDFHVAHGALGICKIKIY